MMTAILAVCAGLTLIGIPLRMCLMAARVRSTLNNARQSGVRFHSDKNVYAGRTYARMQQHEAETGQLFVGKQARFMELMRVVADGPRNTDELRFLIVEGIEPVLRTDGLIYVPCIENAHLSAEGEIALNHGNLDEHLGNATINRDTPGAV